MSGGCPIRSNNRGVAVWHDEVWGFCNKLYRSKLILKQMSHNRSLPNTIFQSCLKFAGVISLLCMQNYITIDMMLWNGKISALLALCAGNSPVTGEFLAQRPVTPSFDVSLVCIWTNGSVNNRDAGDLRRYRAHYDVTITSIPTLKYPLVLNLLPSVFSLVFNI